MTTLTGLGVGLGVTTVVLAVLNIVQALKLRGHWRSLVDAANAAARLQVRARLMP